MTVDHGVFAGLRGAGAERAVEESRADPEVEAEAVIAGRAGH
ncbi:hypothetical protein [Streptomyces sp. LN325]